MNIHLEAAELILDVYRGAGDEIKGVEYIVKEYKDFRIIAFGGSAGIGDWGTNFRAVPWRSSVIGWCHKGFLRGTEATWERLKPLVKDGKPTIVTGHSKGGAEATLLAAFMAKEAKLPIELITFGSPRAGFQQLEKTLENVPSTRYVTENAKSKSIDEVTIVPPAGFFVLRYRHHCDDTRLPPKDEHSMSTYRDGVM